ncbi:MAG: cob(I)yrinic acid a,c-diamide adenosyltransferase [Magnetococcus sp. DMHC-6]
MMSGQQGVSGRVVVLTGEGKGKSSSAFGMVLRAAGWGQRVCVVQFVKGKWPTGEEKAASQLATVDWFALGDGFTWNTVNPDQDRATSRRIWSFCQEKIRSGLYEMVVLDEILFVIQQGWLTGEEIAHFILTQKPRPLHLILTGRGIAPEILAVADTVTEMRAVKHAFQEGGKAVRGIEF